MMANLRGYAQFIAIQRGLMLFMVTVGGAFLIGGTTALLPALYLGIIVFCFWSFADAINNICDRKLDEISDPERAEFTKKLGKIGYLITILFAGLAFALSAITLNLFVFIVISVGMFLGFIYSAPPIRLRTTIVKPIVNFVFGAVAILIAGAYFGTFTSSVFILTLLFGIVTTVNSIWGDLADYQSDKNSGSHTLTVVLGFRNGLIFTFIMGVVLIPIMICVGLMYSMSLIYFIILAGVAAYVVTRLFFNRRALSKTKEDMPEQISLGSLLAKDFVIVAFIFSFTFMISSFIH